MSVTVGTVRSRIRAELNEATQRFYPDSASSGLINWFNDGAARQHRIAIEMARQQDRLGEVANPYLRRYATCASINVVGGTQLYALPATFLQAIRVGVADQAGLNEQDAMAADTSDDWFQRNLPQLRSTYDRASWSLQIDPADSTVKLQLFVFGRDTVPMNPLVARLYHYRDYVRTLDLNPNANVDVDDPYVEGPCWYAIGMAREKSGGDAPTAFAMAENMAQSIIGPPAAAAATSPQNQAEGSSVALENGKARIGA